MVECDWYLNISKDEFETIYKDTILENKAWLFRNKPTDDKELLTVFFPHKIWRLNNLYKVVDKDKKTVRFIMKWGQHKAYKEMVTHNRIIILKTRQLGISTFMCIEFLDFALTNMNSRCGIQAQKLDASEALRNKISFAFNSLSDGWRDVFGVKTDRHSTAIIKFTNGSSVEVSTSFRSGTIHRLLISEYGKISAQSPEKANEIKTGTIQAVGANNLVVIESTAEGKDFQNMWKATVETPTSEEEYKGLFLPWVLDPDCNSDTPYILDAECEEYFHTLRTAYKAHFGETIHLTESQKSWWKNKFTGLIISRNKSMMGREYPAYPNEAFESSESGSYYKKLYLLHIAGQHEVEGLYDKTLPVYAGVDLGYNDTMSFIFFQVLYNELRIVGELHNNGQAIKYYCDAIKETGLRIKLMYLPHDAEHTSMQTAMSPVQLFRQEGFVCRVVPKTRSVVSDIQIVRSVLPITWIDSTLDYIKNMLMNYSKEWDTRLGTWKDKPRHDDWSNPADALRTGVLGFKHQLHNKENVESVEMQTGYTSSRLVSRRKAISYDGLAF